MSVDPKTVITDKETKAVSPGEDLDHGRRRSSLAERVRHSISVQSLDESTVEGQVFSMNDVDPVLDKKMRLVNEVRVSLPWHLTFDVLTGVRCRPLTRSVGQTCISSCSSSMALDMLRIP